MSFTRRKFVLGMGTVIFFTGSASSLLANTRQEKEVRYAMIHDESRCNGCNICARACRKTNHVPAQGSRLSMLGFVLINAVGGNGHHYRIRRQGWLERAAKQTRFYLFGIMQGEEHPFPATTQSKFNPLQQVAYVGVMYGLLPLLLLTGLLCLYPQAVGDVFPGVRYWLLQAHFALAFISLFFIFGHLYLCTTGRTPHETFKSMVDGYHRH